MIGNSIAGFLGVGSAATSYESIATTTVGAGGTSTVTFSSIPSNYTHLQIRILTRDSANAVNQSRSTAIRFNSDSGNNYTVHTLQGDGATVLASATTSTSNATFTSLENTNTSIFSTAIIDILDYTNTNKYKTIKTLAGYDANGSGAVGLYSGLWINTNAITSISLGARSGFTGSFPQYSSFALYGIKG